MITKKEHVKILTILSLAASDTREDTIRSIIINTFFELKLIKRDDLCGQIKILYEFEPYQDEILAIFDTLVEEAKIVKLPEGYVLSSEQRIDFINSEIVLRDQENARFQNFKNFITDDLGVDLEGSQLKLLWSAFVEYLYNSFFEFGEEALNMFHPALNNGNKSYNHEDFVQEALIKLKKDKKLGEVFKKTVDMFPDYASQQDLDFLNELAQKTQSFASLGFNPDMADIGLEKSLIDWTLYLDTNVLYSILSLHSHPESEACKALISIIKTNQQYLKITLRYSELTKVELNGKRDDFGKLDIKLSDSAIKAMLRTNDLDPFSNQFYQNLLDHRGSTVHPSTIIDLSTSLLLKDGIDISRNKKRVEQIGEDYLNVRIQEYRRFIDYKNEVRKEYFEKRGGQFRTINRSDKQIIHDITLREIILSQRSSKLTPNQVPTLNSVKYYAITLDEILIDYDKYDLGNNSSDKGFPVFFRPSFLLNKLVKVLPIKTDNYKKAFIKAITSKGFNRDVQKSQDIQSIVNYLKSQGIDNEDVVYNLISEDLFLERYKKEQSKPGFSHGDFIESQLNKEILAKEDELNTTKEALSKQTEENIQKSEEAKTLEFKKQSLEQERELYKNAATKLSTELSKAQRKTKTPIGAIAIDFDAPDRNKEVESLKIRNAALLERLTDEHKDKVFKRWQRKVWWNLFWVVPITAFFLVLIFNTSIMFPGGFDTSVQKIVFTGIITVVDGVFGFLVKSRYFDEGNMDKRKQRIKTPSDLKILNN